MTGVRASAVYTPEKEYGVTPTGATWYRFPTGLTFDFNPTNSMSSYGEIGSKFISNVTAGKYSLGWTARFKLDYRCIEILGMVFESYTYDSTTGTHIFKKVNNKRVPPASIRLKKLNRYVGGGNDQTFILTGCVVKSFEFSQSSSGATLDCTINGTGMIDIADYQDLIQTDWEGYYDTDDCIPMEWTCLAIGDKPVAYTESVRFSVDNGSEFAYGCGSRFIQNYNEKNATISLSTSVWSVDPDNYQRRMYSGGIDTTHNRPMAKGLKPIPEITLRSFYDSNEDGNNDYTCTVHLYKVWVNSNGQTSLSPSSKIMDSPNLIVTNFSIEIKNDVGKITIWD